ncbi:MAG: hypothetical protein QM704_16965 [Anaeromyxobacteraceae bacterium]
MPAETMPSRAPSGDGKKPVMPRPMLRVRSMRAASAAVGSFTPPSASGVTSSFTAPVASSTSNSVATRERGPERRNHAVLPSGASWTAYGRPARKPYVAASWAL